MYRRQNYLDNIRPFLNKPLVKVISGVRRSGKSSILLLLKELLLKEEINSNQIIYINMESYENRHLSDGESLYNLVKKIRKENKKNIYLLIDEVQEISEWERVVSSLLMEKISDIYITGSNSNLLSGELASLLTGRYVEFHIYPLVYSEFCIFRNRSGNPDNYFQEFITLGGFPGIHQLEFQVDIIYQYLAAIKDSVVLKDIVLRNKIRDVGLLEKILLFIADNIGNIFSARSVADYFKNERRTLGIETVYNYIKYLESAFIVYKAQRFDLKGKKLLETREKYYMADLGLRHALLGYREKDINSFLENIVYLEMKKRGFNVMIGKWEDLEVDFVCERGNERVYIQVCYLLANDLVREREFKPFYKIKDNYPKFVLSMDRIPEGNTDGIQRMYLPNFLNQ